MSDFNDGQGTCCSCGTQTTIYNSGRWGGFGMEYCADCRRDIEDDDEPSHSYQSEAEE